MSHACECGQEISNPRAKKCRACWSKRGADKTEAERIKYFCKSCGEEVSRGGVDKCRKCYLDDRKVNGDQVKVSIPRDYDDAIAQWRQIIGCTQRDYQGPAKRRQSTTQRIAICSDFHAPFQHTEALAAFIERERGSDVCIVAGDLQDHYSISRFTKYESVPIQQELAAAQMILERLSEAFPIVLICEGNHDKPRLEKLLYERLPMDAVEVIRFLSKTGGLSTIEALCGQFSNVEHVKNRVAGKYDVSWYIQHGDLVVTHAEKYSKVPGSALRGIEEWVSDFEGTLNLKPWKVLVQAHTHAQNMIFWGSDRLLVECGCMCVTHGYQLTARLAGRPQRVGWTTLEQKNGITQQETVRIVPIGHVYARDGGMSCTA